MITEPARRQFDLTQEDFSAAMEALNSYVDITEDSLTELLELAKQHAERNVTHPQHVIAGRSYSNGKLGRLWSVRHVIEHDAASREGGVAYRIVAGEGAGQSGHASVEAFRQWARFEVRMQDSGRWVKD